jgi:hypothetical protein
MLAYAVCSRYAIRNEPPIWERESSIPVSAPPKLPTRTKVLFPRFEYEEGAPDKPYNERKVSRRAERRPWLPHVELNPILDPNAIVETTRDLNLKEGWWGVYHRGVGRLTLGRLIQSPFTDTSQLYRSKYMSHEYLWDEQAVESWATEIVLERLGLHRPTFEEVMAILVEHGQSPRNESQSIVMRDGSGEWTEPTFGRDNPERDFNLAVIRELATRVGLGSISRVGSSA